MNICVICSGNICRSPFAEYILKREFPNNHKIYSGGVLEIYDQPAYQVCIDLAPLYSIDLTRHRSQGINFKMIKNTDIFLVMEKNIVKY